MIVRPRNHREVQRVSEFEDLRTPTLYHPHALRRRVTQLNRVKPRISVQLVRGQLRQISGNRQNEKRRLCGYCNGSVAHGIVPVALGVDGKGGIDANHDDVLILIPRLQRGKQHCSIARRRRVARRSGRRPRQALVIRHVRDVEAGLRMPRAIPFRREPLAAVPRKIRVTVKVDHDIVRVVGSQCRHRTRDHRAASVHNQDSDQRRECDAGFAKNRRAPVKPSDYPPDYNDENNCRQHRHVLADRKQRQCV